MYPDTGSANISITGYLASALQIGGIYYPHIAPGSDPSLYSQGFPFVVTSTTQPQSSQSQSTISISSLSPTSAPRGNNVVINWTSTNAPAGSAVTLILFNSSGNEVGVLTQDASSTGSYVWSIPTCVSGPTPTGMEVCIPTDGGLPSSTTFNSVFETTPGNYTIVAKLYTPKGGYGIGGIPPAPSLKILATSPAMPFAVTSN